MMNLFVLKFLKLCAGCLGFSVFCTGCSAGGNADVSLSSKASPPSEEPRSSEQGASSEAATSYKKLIWSDEFDGENGTLPDPGKWVIEIGNNKGWGNNELQYYTDSPENVSLQDGHLVITAMKKDMDKFHYTSTRMKTKGKFDFQYGKVEMRAKLPYGQGIWPAFWMLGEDIDTVNWPACGEIDIMEFIGRQPNTIHGTLHGPEYNGSMGLTKSTTFEGDLHDTFHTYGIEWDANSIRWYFDGEQYHQIIKDNLPSTYTWVYDKKFFLLVNLAIGGNWPGNPDASTEFPQKYVIDYVRVYQ